jgi:hypothetical protein
MDIYVCGDGFMFVLPIYVCDEICDVYMWYLLFVWMEYKKQIKKVYTGHFVECYVAGTRQRGTLCRVPHRALDKEPDMGTLPGGLFV